MQSGKSWRECEAMECDKCKEERERRNRLIAAGDSRVIQDPFVDAPYMHKNNEPKYHAMLLRAAEHAKKLEKHVLWFGAEDTPENPSQLAQSDAQLVARKEKLLQLHDQKTAGIPGITPAYVGLRGRTTEKICCTKEIVILKHMACSLVGWELHPADRRRDIEGPERYLDHLPRCLYLKVEGASWQIHPRLECGVFPLHPVTRSWELNAATSAKIRRRGFTWVPDFASTAFMIQGATLKAGLADCGDVTDRVGSSEAMTSYVILSRLQSAAGLLLLRAFSPMLFRQGEPSGPHVLLKFLRGQKRAKRQTSNDTHEETAGEVNAYTFEDAFKEYNQRTKDLN